MNSCQFDKPLLQIGAVWLLALLCCKLSFPLLVLPCVLEDTAASDLILSGMNVFFGKPLLQKGLVSI